MAVTYFAELPSDIRNAIDRLEQCAAAVAALELKLDNATHETAHARQKLANLIGELIEGPKT